MGLLDNIIGQALGSQGGGSGLEAKLLPALMSLLASKDSGGVTGLLSQLTGSGLGDIVSSWVGTGANKAISAEQVTKGLGGDMIGKLASMAGVSADQVAPALAKILPEAVNKLTPEGKMPSEDMIQAGLKMLKGNLF
jgi:uncharacterized protein YidB (DUF937 family)